VAIIQDISPNPAVIGEEVSFSGYGYDPDGGDIDQYRWTSSLDDFLSDEASFIIDSLSFGEHIISFQVRDDEGVWSSEAIETLVIGDPSTNLVVNLNTGEEFSKIQSAIDSPNTRNGHTIFVYNGYYHESITVDKSIKLLGENRDTTIIDGLDEENVITVQNSALARIIGFTITNGSTGIYITCDYPGPSNTIFVTDNKITDINNGIIIEYSNSSYIEANLIEASNLGIGLHFSSGNIIKNNIIDYESGASGIFLLNGNSTIIECNTISNYGYGIYLDGRWPHWGFFNKVHYNNLIDNTVQATCHGYFNNWSFNYWSDFENNPGYPSKYIIPGDHSIDYYPLDEPFGSDPGKPKLPFEQEEI
jgi:nitrous oxidase accessory protein NosD